jgi:hypothetical protein
MQPEFGGYPRFKFFRNYQFVEILALRAVNTKGVERGTYLGGLTRVPILSASPLKKYLGNAGVRHLIVTLVAHQEEVGYIVCATKGTRSDMATLKRNFAPAEQNFVPRRMRSFDVVFGAIRVLPNQ